MMLRLARATTHNSRTLPSPPPASLSTLAISLLLIAFQFFNFIMGGGSFSDPLSSALLESPSPSICSPSAAIPESPSICYPSPSSLELDLSNQQELDSASGELLDDSARLRLKRRKTYIEVLASYETASGVPEQALHDAKDAIVRHKPGDWIEEVGGTKAGDDYQVPDAITLLLLGPKGAGKSSLINKISRVFEADCDAHFSPDRAQVSHNLDSSTPGTCFLQEYLIPRRNSPPFCMYDTRGLSLVPTDDLKFLKRWMTEGVTHGDMIIRESDDEATKKMIKSRARQGLFSRCQRRMVNFVLFVIDGVSVLKSISSGDAQYINMLHETFNYPFLSFKDNKPVVVVTHGDELSLADRARVRIHLGELLCIPPDQQIFDIPETRDHVTELAIVRMLRYSIEQANRNFPYKQPYLLEAPKMTLRMMDRLQGFELWTLVIEVVIILLCIIALLFRSS